MEQEISCPSGLKGIIRSTKVRDEELLLDPKLSQRGELIKTLLERCWLSVTDPGPYVIKDGKFNWLDALDGDAFYALIQLRILSYTADYTFAAFCPRCRRASDNDQDLTELVTKLLPETSREHVVSKQPFETSLYGKLIKYRLLTLRDERAISMLCENRKLSARLGQLAQRIVSVEGIPPMPGAVLEFLRDFESTDMDDFEALIEAADCGVDTKVDFTCGFSECRAQTRIDLPFEARFFKRPAKPLASAQAPIG